METSKICKALNGNFVNNVCVVDVKDKSIALTSLKHKKSENLLIADKKEDIWNYTRHKDLISMVLYEDE